MWNLNLGLVLGFTGKKNEKKNSWTEGRPRLYNTLLLMSSTFPMPAKTHYCTLSRMTHLKNSHIFPAAGSIALPVVLESEELGLKGGVSSVKRGGAPQTNKAIGFYKA